MTYFGAFVFGAGLVVTSNAPTGTGSVQPYGTHAYGTGSFGAGQVVTSQTPVGPSGGGQNRGRGRTIVNRLDGTGATEAYIEGSIMAFLATVTEPKTIIIE